jgi:hypothetical protein
MTGGQSEPRRENEIPERERALVDLVKLDYDATLRTISGVLSTGTSIRVAGFAAWGVLLGLSLRDDSWALSVFAAAVVALFAYADAHHAALYRRGLSRAVALESLLDRYVDRLGIDTHDQDAVDDVLAELETHRFGTYRTMRRLHRKDFLGARPRPIFLFIYPVLFAAAVIVAFVTAC